MSQLKNVTDTKVMYRIWKARRAKAVILLVHGLGAHSARWDFLGKYFSKKSYSCYAIELRGFGELQDYGRGHIDSFKVYYRDLMLLLTHIKWENPGKELFLLGESMGALMAFNMAALYPKEFNGVALISPAFKNAMKFPITSYLSLAASLFYNHKKEIPVPFSAAMCTRDVKQQKFMESDPRELRTASTKMLINIMAEQMRAKKLMKSWADPVLFLIPGRDVMIDEHESRKVYEQLKIRNKKIIEYPEMYHALSIDLGREKVFDDIIAWIKR